MMKSEREQRALLASYGVAVVRERSGKGTHKVLYCRGPAGQQFSVVLAQHMGNWRSINNLERRIRHALK
jgi:hypothetical protein